ncbi:MAG: cell division topological specificity factor MinE [Chloroflexota bacterium]
MGGFFDKMLGRNSDEEKGSSATAKDRLKMVLTHDRIKISPEKMKEMKAEIIEVITRYVPSLDPESVDIALDQSDRFNNRLVAEIPFASEREEPDLFDNDGNDDLIISTDETLKNADVNIASDEVTADVFSFELEDETLDSRPDNE